MIQQQPAVAWKEKDGADGVLITSLANPGSNKAKGWVAPEEKWFVLCIFKMNKNAQLLSEPADTPLAAAEQSFLMKAPRESRAVRLKWSFGCLQCVELNRSGNMLIVSRCKRFIAIHHLFGYESTTKSH